MSPVNCRKCKNRFVCSLVNKAGELDGLVSCIAADDGCTQTTNRYPNIIIDTLFELLPKCCKRFDKKDIVPRKHVFLPITPVRAIVLRTIELLTASNGHFPTVRQISHKMGRSVATIQEHINNLCSSGHLIKQHAGRRMCNYVINPQLKDSND